MVSFALNGVGVSSGIAIGRADRTDAIADRIASADANGLFVLLRAGTETAE